MASARVNFTGFGRRIPHLQAIAAHRVYSVSEDLPRTRPLVSTMLIHELTADECADILSRTHVGRLGCARFNQPYVVPTHFSFDREENYIYAFSMLGQKIEWMRKNPRVCLEVEEITDKNHWTTVIAVGRYKEIRLDPAHDDARRRAEQLFQQRREWWLPGAARTPAGEREHVVLYRIEVDRVTGRRAASERQSRS